MKAEEWKDELLMSLLECGYRDLERLREVLALAGKFSVSIDDVTDYARDIADKNIDVNTLLYSAMRLTLDKIAEEVEDEETAEKIRDHEVFVNYMDSWFGLESLDELDVEEVEKTPKEKIVSTVVEEILAKKSKL